MKIYLPPQLEGPAVGVSISQPHISHHSGPGPFWSPESLSGAPRGNHPLGEQDSLEVKLQGFGFPGDQRSKLNRFPTPRPPCPERGWGVEGVEGMGGRVLLRELEAMEIGSGQHKIVSLLRRLNWRLLKSCVDKRSASGPPAVKGTGI